MVLMLETPFSSNKILSNSFEVAATDVRYFERRKFLISLVHKKNLAWCD